MSELNYYQILELSNNATEEEIKKSYRRLSLLYHPDRNPSPDANSKIREINTAYETLGNGESRKMYDLQLNGGGMNMNIPHGNGGQHMFFHTNFGGNNVDIGNIDNLFQNIFGGMNNNAFQQHIFQQLNKPPPIIANIKLTISQCYTGCVIPIEINKWDIINNVRHHKTEKIEVTIPECIDNNEAMILRDCGNSINNKIKGDIKILISIVNNESPSNNFERIGMDLLHRHTITLKESLCGYSYILNHPNGSAYNINNNTKIVSPNDRQLINKLGMKKGDEFGNLIIEYTILFPQSLEPSKIQVLNEIL